MFKLDCTVCRHCYEESLIVSFHFSMSRRIRPWHGCAAVFWYSDFLILFCATFQKLLHSEICLNKGSVFSEIRYFGKNEIQVSLYVRHDWAPLQVRYFWKLSEGGDQTIWKVSKDIRGCCPSRPNEAQLTSQHFCLWVKFRLRTVRVSNISSCAIIYFINFLQLY